MALESKLDFYSIEELEDIRVQWLEAKKKIDAEMEGSYPRDIRNTFRVRMHFLAPPMRQKVVRDPAVRFIFLF